jgi:uncharacterized integral membrane protein
MRKVKYGFWLILLGLLGVVFWQNRPFFLTKQEVAFNYGVGAYQTPELQVALYFLIFFLVGLLISYFSSLSERFAARKTIRKLNEELAGARKQIADLESALASRQVAAADHEASKPSEPAAGVESSEASI